MLHVKHMSNLASSSINLRSSEGLDGAFGTEGGGVGLARSMVAVTGFGGSTGLMG